MSWIEDYRDEIISKMPEVREDINTFREKVNKANCPSCVKRRLERNIKRLIQEKMTPGMFSRELENIIIPSYIKVANFSQLQSEKIHSTKQETPSLETSRIATPNQKDPSEMNIHDERQGCIDCVRKHLSQAMILLRECNQGYGTDDFEHKWLAVGHLAEAADEALHVDPDLSMKIRDIRLSIMEQGQ